MSIVTSSFKSSGLSPASLNWPEKSPVNGGKSFALIPRVQTVSKNLFGVSNLFGASNEDVANKKILRSDVSTVQSLHTPTSASKRKLFDYLEEEEGFSPKRARTDDKTNQVSQTNWEIARNRNHLPCPATPKKTPIQRKLSPFAKKALEVSATDTLIFQTHNDASIKFQRGEQIGKGDYCEVFEVTASEKLFENYENNEILIKCYKKELIVKDNSRIIEYLTNSLTQYKQLKSLEYPITKILNVETAEKDAFILVEKVPKEFSIDWQKNTPIALLSETTQNYLNQIKQMFQIAFDQKLYLDLSASNVRINNSEQVVLIDFMEEKGSKKWDNPFQIVLNKHLKSFAQGNDEIYEYLIPNGAIHPITDQLVVKELVV